MSLRRLTARLRRRLRRLGGDRRAIARLRDLIKRARRKAAAPTVMYDSVTVSEIPAQAEAVAGYVNGSYTTFPELVRRFPHAKLLSIAVSSSANAECLDVEPGDATPKDAPAWVRRQLARGVKRPVVYASASNIGAVLSELTRAGLKRSQFRLWSAHYNGKRHICGPHTCGYTRFDVDATQWTDTSLGRNLDESALSPTFFD